MLNPTHSVTTSLHCAGAPPVAVLCESGCVSACVLQSERKKKRVSGIIQATDVLKTIHVAVSQQQSLDADQDTGGVSQLRHDMMVKANEVVETLKGKQHT
jgi:hypothetical protein